MAESYQDQRTPEQKALMARVYRSLTNHTPDGRTVEAIEAIRRQAKQLANWIIVWSKPSREQSLALTHLEETVMWAVKNLVLNGRSDVEEGEITNA